MTSAFSCQNSISLCPASFLIQRPNLPVTPRSGTFLSLGRYIPKYFILFVAMVNGIVSLISLSIFLLLMYRNARDFLCDFISFNFTIFID